MLGAPRFAETVGLNPPVPLTPVLKIPMSTLVYPKRASLTTVGEKICVLPSVKPFESPNSSPADGPAGRSLPFGEVPNGKKLSRERAVLDLL
jgi:hypothetical protein